MCIHVQLAEEVCITRHVSMETALGFCCSVKHVTELLLREPAKISSHYLERRTKAFSQYPGKNEFSYEDKLCVKLPSIEGPLFFSISLKIMAFLQCNKNVIILPTKPLINFVDTWFSF